MCVLRVPLQQPKLCSPLLFLLLPSLQTPPQTHRDCCCCCCHCCCCYVVVTPPRVNGVVVVVVASASAAAAVTPDRHTDSDWRRGRRRIDQKYAEHESSLSRLDRHSDYRRQQRQGGGAVFFITQLSSANGRTDGRHNIDDEDPRSVSDSLDT